MFTAECGNSMRSCVCFHFHGDLHLMLLVPWGKISGSGIPWGVPLGSCCRAQRGFPSKAAAPIPGRGSLLLSLRSMPTSGLFACRVLTSSGVSSGLRPYNPRIHSGMAWNAIRDWRANEPQREHVGEPGWSTEATVARLVEEEELFSSASLTPVKTISASPPSPPTEPLRFKTAFHLRPSFL